MADAGERHFDRVRVTRVDWPIIVTEFPEKRVPDEAHLGVLGYLESLLSEAASRRERLFFITDLTVMRELAPSSQRKATADWLERTSALARAGSVGSAHVTPSAMLRGLITAVVWIHRPPTPSVCVATVHEAMLHGIQLLEAARMRVPAKVLALRDGGVARTV